MRREILSWLLGIVCVFVLLLPPPASSETVVESYLDAETGIVTFTRLEDGIPVATWRLQQSITTRFRRTSGDGQPGGEIEAGVEDPYGVDADTRFKNLEKEEPVFLSDWDQITPSYNNYHGQTTACTEVKVEESYANSPHVADGVAAFHEYIYEVTGVHVDVLNYDPGRDLTSYVKESHDNLQVLNNIPFGTSLFTVVFPQGWKRHDAGLVRHPVILCGQGYTVDNNYMYRRRTPHLYMIQKVAASAENPQLNSAILIISNTGGREGQGIHSNAISDLEGFLKYTRRFVVSELDSPDETIDLGLDLQKIMTANGSRAGNTALVWGANPLLADYNVAAIHAFVPPVKIGSMLRLSFFTYPALNYVTKQAMGARGAYKYSYRDPFTDKVLTPDEKAVRIGHTFTGQTTIKEIDDHSAYGVFSRPELVDGLREKRITISEGTHDAYMPMPYFIEFDNLLRKLGIGHATCIGYVYGHGHMVAKSDPPWDDDTFEVHKTVAMLVQNKDLGPYDGHLRVFHMPATIGCSGFGEKELRIDADLLERINELRPNYFPAGHSPTKLGFSATLPAKAVSSLPFTISLIGESGQSWKIWGRPETGYHPVYSASGVFGEDMGIPDVLEHGSEWVILHLSNGLPTGNYEWFFEYAGKEIPNRFTPFVSPGGLPSKTVTQVLPDEVPCYGQTDGCGTYFHDNGCSNENLSFGVDFYHPLLLQPNRDPRLEPLHEIVGYAGETLAFALSATDPDGDPVVYDLRNRFGGFLGPDVQMNGRSGEVNTFLEIGDVGRYYLTAIAKDGKGGIDKETFVVNIKPAP